MSENGPVKYICIGCMKQEISLKEYKKTKMCKACLDKNRKTKH